MRSYEILRVYQQIYTYRYIYIIRIIQIMFYAFQASRASMWAVQSGLMAKKRPPGADLVTSHWFRDSVDSRYIIILLEPVRNLGSRPLYASIGYCRESEGALAWPYHLTGTDCERSSQSLDTFHGLSVRFHFTEGMLVMVPMRRGTRFSGCEAIGRKAFASYTLSRFRPWRAHQGHHSKACIMQKVRHVLCRPQNVYLRTVYYT